MKVIKLNNIRDISDYRQIWDQLNQQNSNTINDDFDWILLLYKYFGHTHDNAFYVLKYQNNVLALLPMIQRMLYARKTIPYKQLTHIGTRSGITDFCSLYYQTKGDMLTRALNIIFTPYQQIQLKNILPHTLENILNNLDLSQNFKSDILESTKNIYIKLANYKNWHEYYNQLSKNTRRELKKRINKLNNFEWTIRDNEKMETSRLLDIIRSIHISRQKMLGRTSLFEQKLFNSYLNELIDVFRGKQYLDYSLLYLQDKPISFTLGFIKNDIYYHWLIGFEPEYHAFSPNKVHHMYLIKRLVNLGISEFNFMRGDSPYKFKWSSAYRIVYEIKLWNQSTLYKRLFSYVKTSKSAHLGHHSYL